MKSMCTKHSLFYEYYSCTIPSLLGSTVRIRSVLCDRFVWLAHTSWMTGAREREAPTVTDD